MKKIIYNDSLILYVILLNVGIIYLHSFQIFEPYYLIFDITDIVLTLFFGCEISIKILDQKSNKKLKSYLKDPWNKIDFFSVILALPSIGILFYHHLELFAGFTALRSLRIFKFLRIIEYIPSGKEISKQMFKAFKSISFIIFIFIIYSTIISLISFNLFKEYAPSYFNNAFDAFFTIFKIFSGDGFSDVVGEIERHCSIEFLYFTKFYFVFIVFTGSILGLSLINSIFMNQMSQVDEHIEDSEKDVLKILKAEMNALKDQNAALMNEIKKIHHKEN
jgi:voltage-gated sodium channel